VTPRRRRISTANGVRHGHDAGEQVLGIGESELEFVGDAAAVLERLLQAGHDGEAFVR